MKPPPITQDATIHAECPPIDGSRIVGIITLYISREAATAEPPFNGTVYEQESAANRKFLAASLQMAEALETFLFWCEGAPAYVRKQAVEALIAAGYTNEEPATGTGEVVS